MLFLTGSSEIGPIISDKRADLEGTGESGYTRLEALAANGHVSGIRLLLRRGAQINGRTPGEVTPLMVAATHERLAVVRELLRRGAKLDLRDGKGRTALHHAAFSGHAEIAEALLKSGARINAKDAQDYSPLSIALDGEYSEEGGPRFCRIIRVLLRYGASQADQGRLSPDEVTTRERVRAALRRCREAAKPGASERRARAYSEARAKLAAEVDPRKFYEKEMNRVMTPDNPPWHVTGTEWRMRSRSAP